MVGRKRKSGKRHPGGQLVRKQPTRLQIAAAMPHRRNIPARLVKGKWVDQRDDYRAECPIGRLNLAGFITDGHFDAAEKYRSTVARYRAVIESPRNAQNILASQYVPPPAPKGEEYPVIPFRLRLPITDEEAERRLAEYQGATESVEGHRCRVVVKSVVIYEKELVHGDLPYLLSALNRLKEFYDGLTRTRKHALTK